MAGRVGSPTVREGHFPLAVYWELWNSFPAGSCDFADRSCARNTIHKNQPKNHEAQNLALLRNRAKRVQDQFPVAAVITFPNTDVIAFFSFVRAGKLQFIAAIGIAEVNRLGDV